MATYTSTQPKLFPENVSATVKENLVDLREEDANEDVTANTLSPSDSTTGRGSARNRDSGIHSVTYTTMESRPLLNVQAQDSSSPLRNGGNKGEKLPYKCVIIALITLLILLCIGLILTYITLEVTNSCLHNTQQSSITHSIKNSATIYDKFTCTGVYTLFARLSNHLELINQVEVRGIPGSIGDTALVFLMECKNIVYGSATDQDCRSYCGIPQDNTITRLTASNNTQECTLCIPEKNRNTHDAHCNQLCQFNVTSELIYSANGSSLCMIGKGMSSGDGTCQQTQVRVTVEPKQSSRIIDVMVLRSVCVPLIAVLVIILSVTSVKLYHKRHKSGIEAVENTDAETYTYIP